MADFKPEITNDYLYMLFSDPSHGKEKEYVQWELVKNQIDLALVPGILSTRFYVMSDVQNFPAGPRMPKYMTMFHIRAEDLGEWKKMFDGMYASGELEGSPKSHDGKPILDQSTLQGYNYHLLKKGWKGVSGQSSMEAGHPDYLEVMFDDAYPGQDEDMNRFYEEARMPQLMEMPVVLNGYRGLLSDIQLTPPKVYGPKWFSYCAYRAADPTLINPLLTKTPAPASMDRPKHWSYTYKALNFYEMGNRIRAAREARAAEAAK